MAPPTQICPRTAGDKHLQVTVTLQVNMKIYKGWFSNKNVLTFAPNSIHYRNTFPCKLKLKLFNAYVTPSFTHLSRY